MTQGRKCPGKLAGLQMILSFFQIIRCPTGSEKPQKDLTKLSGQAGGGSSELSSIENIMLGIKGTAV